MLDGDLSTKELYTGKFNNGYIGENYEVYSDKKLIKKVCTKIFKNGNYISATYDLLNNKIILISNEGINKFKINSINDNIRLQNKQITYKDLFEY